MNRGYDSSSSRNRFRAQSKLISVCHATRKTRFLESLKREKSFQKVRQRNRVLFRIRITLSFSTPVATLLLHTREVPQTLRTGITAYDRTIELTLLIQSKRAISKRACQYRG